MEHKDIPRKRKTPMQYIIDVLIYLVLVCRSVVRTLSHRFDGTFGKNSYVYKIVIAKCCF